MVNEADMIRTLVNTAIKNIIMIININENDVNSLEKAITTLFIYDVHIT